MAPVNNKDTYEDSLPWDPLWEFVLGSDDEQPKKRSLFARKEPETQESFMDYWFSSGDEKELKPTKSIDLKKSSSGKGLFGSRRQSKPDDESSFFSAPSSFSKEDERHERSTSRGSSLWRRTRSPEEEDSIIGFLDQPYEITEKEYLRKQKKENKKKAREESKARSKAESSSKKHKKTSKGTRIGSFSKRSESKKMKSDDDSWVSGLSLESLGLSGKKKKRSGPFAGWKKRRQDKKTVKENVQKSTATSARSQRQRPAKDDYTEGPSLIESFTEAFDPWGETHEESESSEYETSVYSEEEGEDDDGTTTSYESSYRSEATSSVYTEESGMVAAPAISTPASAFTRAISPQRTQSSANYQYTNEVRLKYQPKASERSATRPSTRGATLFDEDKTTEESVTTATTSVSREPTSVPRERDERSQEAPVTASEVPDSLPKSKPNSVFDEDSIYNLGRHRGVGRIVCCSVKNLGDRASIISQETGLPIHELTKEQLAEIFPKVRSISETAPMMRGRSRIIGNSNSFERDLPAHVQALVAENGPQSLYEYEFEKGTHKVVLYNKFGTDPRSLLKVHTSELPPILFEQSLQTMNKVIVQVEASTVSMTDCLLREGQMIGGRPIPLPNSPGVDIVGKIYRIDRHTSRQFDICAGDRVMALTKFGGNARYLAISPEQLIKVPEEIDPAEAACLTETYLTAFQTLHFNQGFMSRYRKTALRGRSIVIIGEMTSSMGRAIAQLSSTAGVDNIYATAKPKHYQRLTALGILPLSLDPLEWYERLRGKIDLIISLEEEITPLHYKLLTSNGEIVKVTQSEVGAYAFGDESSQFSFDTRSRMVCSRVRAQNNSRLYHYNVFKEWEENLGRCKGDIEYLIKLLEERRIVPHIVDRIPLNKVAKAQEIIESKNVPGFIVCEPWLVSKCRAVLL